MCFLNEPKQFSKTLKNQFFKVGTRYCTRDIFVHDTDGEGKVHEKQDTVFSKHESIHWWNVCLQRFTRCV